MIIESVKIALRALSANKLRAALTMLGIIIGVGAVITLMSLGRGLEKSVADQFEGMGSNLMFVFPDYRNDGSSRRMSAGELSNADVAALRDKSRVPDARAVSGVTQYQLMVTAGRHQWRLTVQGIAPEFATMSNWKLRSGRCIDAAAMAGNQRVAVLGSKAAQALFPDVWAIGQDVKLAGLPFRVIGVLQSKGGSAMGDEDNAVFVPLSTAQRYVAWRGATGEPMVSMIYVQAAGKDHNAALTQQVKDVLRQRHKVGIGEKDDFQILAQADLMAAFSQVMGALTLFLGAIAGISLLVGGIGIMNIMLVSVTERTREIGLRKAIGAKRRDILAQFLIEAVALALVGGAVGVLLGGGGTSAIAGLSKGQVPAVLAPDAVMLALAFSAAVGLFFGIYPAWRAARLNPIEALRYE